MALKAYWVRHLSHKWAETRHESMLIACYSCNQRSGHDNACDLFYIDGKVFNIWVLFAFYGDLIFPCVLETHCCKGIVIPIFETVLKWRGNNIVDFVTLYSSYKIANMSVNSHILVHCGWIFFLNITGYSSQFNIHRNHVWFCCAYLCTAQESINILIPFGAAWGTQCIQGIFSQDVFIVDVISFVQQR